MKWKDTGEMVDKGDSAIEEENFDDEQYSPWAGQKGDRKHSPLIKSPVLLVLLVAAIVALIGALLILVMGGRGGAASPQRLASLDARLQNLEERLDKYEAIDEKVMRIWEQAKSFEKFKNRFDRSEASTSLRMDHLTMSLETLQKQLGEGKRSAAIPKSTKKSASLPKKKNIEKADQGQYHQVLAGDTLYSISKKYKLKVDQLLLMNQMKPGSMIQPGQKLIVRRHPD